MQVRVLYFATLRQRAGVREERLALPRGATVADLKARLADLHEPLRAALGTALVAVNREFAFPDQPVGDGDEIAVFPPVSGGGAPNIFQITREPLDLNGLLRSLVLPTTGAACVFTGVVRGQTDRQAGRRTDHLEYEAYEPMAREKMEQVAAEIRRRWPEVEGVAIVQRVGRLEPGTPTVLIACTAAHRDTGVFEAARYGIDRLKEIVPVWKQEVGSAGEDWVEGKYRPVPADRRPSATRRRNPAKARGRPRRR